MTRQEKAANMVVNKCLEIKKGESILILASEPLMDIARQLYHTCSKRTKSAFLLQTSHFSPTVDFNKALAKMMKEMNAIIAVTSPSISHTEALRQACRAGVRIASMPNISMNTFCRIADANFEKIGRRSKKIADILSMAKEAKVTAPNGTEMTIALKKRKGYSDTGLINTPGAFSNLPAGAASISPYDGMCRGMFVVDSGMGVNPNGEDQISITIKDGRAQRISGGPMARKVSQHLSRFGPESRIIAEFGIGVNDAAQISGCSLEDEKVMGSIHIALGNNTLTGGVNSIPVRFEAVAYKASVEIDGKVILHKGKLMLD